MKLKAIGNYRNGARGLDYPVGQVIEVDAPLGEFLLRDAPGCFVEMIDAPPVDKMIDLSDGVNNQEARLASDALRARGQRGVTK